MLTATGGWEVSELPILHYEWQIPYRFTQGYLDQGYQQVEALTDRLLQKLSQSSKSSLSQFPSFSLPTELQDTYNHAIAKLSTEFQRYYSIPETFLKEKTQQINEAIHALSLDDQINSHNPQTDTSRFIDEPLEESARHINPQDVEIKAPVQNQNPVVDYVPMKSEKSRDIDSLSLNRKMGPTDPVIRLNRQEFIQRFQSDEKKPRPQTSSQMVGNRREDQNSVQDWLESSILPSSSSSFSGGSSLIAQFKQQSSQRNQQILRQ